MPAPYENFDDLTITELGRTILRYLLNLQVEYGHRNASFRKVRIDLLREVDAHKPAGSFNWGFEAVFTQELHVLEELGLISVKYGSGAIMAGRTRNQIYNLSLTDDGTETARTIVDRDNAKKAAEAKTADTQEESDRDDSTAQSAMDAETIVDEGVIDASPTVAPPPPQPEPPEKPSTAEIAPTGKIEPPQKLP
ncbi:MAG: hypothetical protein IT462_03280 [Planctomycetes bacterium]|nr:hypothetical protein [Planctomycetota bacterium]